MGNSVIGGSISAGIDYLGCTIFMPGVEDPRTGKIVPSGHADLAEIISASLFGLGPEVLSPVGHGSKAYAEMWQGPLAGFMWHRLPKSGAGHCHVELKGEACALLGYARLQGFLQAIEAAGYRVRLSRADVAFDGVPFVPRMVRDAWVAGRVQTRIRSSSWEWFESETGTTFYYGLRASGRVVRVYDRRGPTRIEVEVREQRAEVFGRLLAQTSEAQFLAIAAAELASAAQFLGDDGKVAPWWRAVLEVSDMASPLKLERRQASLSAAVVVVHQARDQLWKLLGRVAVLAAGLGWDADAVAASVASFDLSDPESSRDVVRLRAAVAAAGALAPAAG